MISRSPAAWPPGAGLPWPRRRIFLPSSMPAGILTVIFGDLPLGRRTSSSTSPPVIAVVKGIVDFGLNVGPASPAAGRALLASGRNGGGTGRRCRPGRRPASTAETVAEELAEVDILGAEPATPPRRGRAPNPSRRGPPAPIVSNELP